MKTLVTSNDHGLIEELAFCLKDEGIDIHVGNQGTSSLPGSGSYQQSVYVLNPNDYDRAQEILSDIDDCHRMKNDYELSAGGSESSNNKWLVFVVSLLVALLFFISFI